jgi:hypothetical protein
MARLASLASPWVWGWRLEGGRKRGVRTKRAAKRKDESREGRSKGACPRELAFPSDFGRCTEDPHRA